MREKFNRPKRKKTRNNIFFVLAAFFHISTRQAEQESRVLFVCLNQLARNARVSGKKNYVGEEKKYIGHILKYKAHISKYVRHIFQPLFKGTFFGRARCRCRVDWHGF
jgi:hypothetical protein